MKQAIQKAVNLLFIEKCKLDDDYSSVEFKIFLELEFPNLQFTYNVRTKEWLLID
jgi:hypothetical protein